MLVQRLEEDGDLFRDCTDSLGSDDPKAGPPEAKLQLIRQSLAEIVGADDAKPLDAAQYDCEVAGGLLEAWCKAARDPDTEAASWPRLGAPAGILDHPQQVGVFPDAVEDEFLLDPLTTEFDAPATRQSYAGVEACPHALEEVERLTSLGYLTKCGTEEDLENVCGEGAKVISKFGQITKEREGKTKRRLTLDAKDSGVTPCARKNQSILLPWGQ